MRVSGEIYVSGIAGVLLPRTGSTFGNVLAYATPSHRSPGWGGPGPLEMDKFRKIPKSVRSNCTSLIFFNTKAKAQLEIIREEFLLLDKKSFENLIKFCFDKQHNFIFINKEGFFYKNLQKINFPD